MKIKMAIFVFLLLPAFTLQAQKGLKGKWEGTITFGGYDKKEGEKFEIYIESKGSLVLGRTYVYDKNSKVIVRKFRGRIYQDRSMYLEEIPDPAKRDTTQGNQTRLRSYQFLYTRSIFDSTLEGHWQEVRKDPLAKNRAIGRIYMRKSEKSKA